jgi:hypothetical protein
MLLWINGPFGGGKTATAHELNRRLPGSAVCDPELAIAPSADGPLRAALRQYATTIRHIRFD